MADKEENMEVSEKARSTKQNCIAIREEGNIITDEKTILLKEEELKEVKANNKSICSLQWCFHSQAFQLFDGDADGLISLAELRRLVARVGGRMSEGEAR